MGKENTETKPASCLSCFFYLVGDTISPSMADELHSSAARFRLSLSQLGESNSESQNFLENEQYSDSPNNFLGFASDNSENFGEHNVVVLGQEDTSDVVLGEAEPCRSVPETEGAIKKQEAELQETCSRKCPFEIPQVIDETVQKDPCLVNDINDNDISIRNRKEKKPRQRKRKAGKNKDTLLNCNNEVWKKEKKGLMYSREEMVAFRFEEMEEQKKIWVELYCRLDPLVRQEYDGLIKCDVDNHNQEHVVNFDPRPQFRKAVNLGEDCSQVADNQFQNCSTSDHSSCLPGSDETGCLVLEEKLIEDDDGGGDDSDEDYSSIQKPAFMVTGEPDFDSGPPLDGLEYLRRVRWEAAQIPKVKVSKVVKVKEQRPYMPQIPDIMDCPNNLLPLKEWEDSFLADFSELRLEFSQLESRNSSTTNASNSLPIHASIFLENLDGITSTGNSSQHESPTYSSITSDYPTLSVILKMGPAARNSMLIKRISTVENMTTLPRNDCLWLFALCAAVDIPLDADSCAALRCLLRKCASLRAAKTELDEEAVMLNILATISGRYFGQLEK